MTTDIENNLNVINNCVGSLNSWNKLSGENANRKITPRRNENGHIEYKNFDYSLHAGITAYTAAELAGEINKEIHSNIQTVITVRGKTSSKSF